MYMYGFKTTYIYRKSRNIVEPSVEIPTAELKTCIKANCSRRRLTFAHNIH